MKKVIKVRHGRDFWQDEIKKQSLSGLCVSDFCRDQGLVEGTFYAWRRRLGSEAAASDGVSFAPISIKAPVSAGVDLLLPGGLVLRFSGLAPVDYLRQISAAYVVL